MVARVARLGLGLAALGRPAYITLGHGADFGEGRAVAQMEAHAHRVLDRAWAAGIRYVDAARSYGRSEEFLRSWLRARRLTREEITVGSKWGYRYVGDWRLDAPQHEVKDHSLAALEAQAAESLALLGDWLALYQIHSATPESRVLEDSNVLDRLARLKAEKGLRIGVSVSGPRQGETIRRALEIVSDGRRLFDSVQATWNLLERSAGPALREAHDAGLTVIVKEALANGRLTVRGAEGKGGPLAELSKAKRAAPDALALASVLAEPWADTVLLGAATVEQLESNLGALAIDLAPGELDPLTSLEQPTAAYWSVRSQLPWS